MCKFNKSHLNIVFTRKILKACIDSMTMSVQHVKNRKNNAVLAVRYRDGKFLITGQDGKNIAKDLVKKFYNTVSMITFINNRVTFDANK